MIAKVCDRESRRDSWFENRLVGTTCGETFRRKSLSHLSPKSYEKKEKEKEKLPLPDSIWMDITISTLNTM